MILLRSQIIERKMHLKIATKRLRVNINHPEQSLGGYGYHCFFFAINASFLIIERAVEKVDSMNGGSKP